MGVRTPLSFAWCCLLVVALVVMQGQTVDTIDAAERKTLSLKVKEMFYHAYDSYLTHAYPADELKPLSCAGRVRGVDKSRGDIDDALGNFALTMVDTLDSLVVLGNVTEFLRAVKLVIQDVTFDTNLDVSTFETNIRVLGGLLSAHALVLDLRTRKRKSRTARDFPFLLEYRGELLTMATDLGNRLLKAFDSKTGLPYSKINLRYGLTPSVKRNDATCTACAGTMIMEFAALSRFTGDPAYESAARHAMQALWSRRGPHSHLVGTTINITSGAWLRREAGVGAGIDSYYEYLLKAYVMLGDEVYLNAFNKHYASIMHYLKRGPYLVNANMNTPHRMSRSFMDALQTFWPGLQVLKGDIEPAIETHKMYWQLTERYGFIPEAFTGELKLNWANSPLRPEFAESTYFLYTATKNPFYLEVGKTILQKYEQHARVKCGYAAISDVRTWKLEDKMDSFVLAETFKYLYLLFTDESEIPIDVHDYVFTTEAHLLPLSLSSIHPKLDPLYDGSFQHFDVKLHDHSCSNDDRDLSQFQRLMHLRSNILKTCPSYRTPAQRQGNVPKVAGKNSANSRTTTAKAHTTSARMINPIEISPSELDVENEAHIAYLNLIGIFLDYSDEGIRLVHAADPEDNYHTLGTEFMKELIALAGSPATPPTKESVIIRVTGPDDIKGSSVQGGPAAFGPDLDTQKTIFSGELILVNPILACTPLAEKSLLSKIAVVHRGGCMFIEKVRHAQAAGALAVIVVDTKDTTENKTLFTMSGDGSDDVTIPSVFLYLHQYEALFKGKDANAKIKSGVYVSVFGSKWS